MGLDGRGGGVSVGQGWCRTPISPHTLQRSGSHLKHMLLLFGCMRFGSSGGEDTDGDLTGRGTDFLTQTLKKARREHPANKKEHPEAAGAAAEGET